MPPSVCDASTYDGIISRLFSTTQFKSKYYDYNRVSLKCFNKFSTKEFLKRCLEQDVIPNNFKIKNQPASFTSLEFKQQWLAESREQSLRWIQSAIDELDTAWLSLCKERDTKKTLLFSDLTESDKIHLEEFLLRKSRKTLNQQSKAKNNKIKNLLQKQNRDQYTNQIPERSNENQHQSKRRNRPGIKQRKYRSKILKKIQKENNLDMVFNFSKYHFNQATINLLNKGLNFCIKPFKVDLAEILADHSTFSRRMMWAEVYHNQEKVEFKPPIFKTEKTNMPNQNMVPKPLQTMLNTVESNIQDKNNWNRKHLNPKIKNLPNEEYLALLKLIEMQNDRLIVVKPADKGAGIVIMNYEDYVTSCNQHLTATQPQPDGPPLPYYKKTTSQEFNKLKQSISAVLNIGKEREYLSNAEFKAMLPTEKGSGRFYQLFKVHKSYPEGSLPPGRPIVSGNGSVTENISKFVDFHSKCLTKNVPSFIEDTPDFLRILDTLNKSNEISDSDILVTIDVSSLYTNIKQEEGISSMRSALNRREDKTIPTEFLIKLLELVLKGNFFEFANQLYQQLVGTAMGTPIAPTYATIFMSDVDDRIYKLAQDIAETENPIRILKRFLDDIFMIWKGKLTDLERFLEEINNLHPTIKFTYEHTCPFYCTYPQEILHDCFCYTSRSIPFLDTLVTIKNKTLVTDVYRKPTDRCQYLLPTSNHPAHISSSIPYSLCYRLVRIVSEKSTLEKRFNELKQLLQNRCYNDKIIDGAISKAKAIEREEALKKKPKKYHLEHLLSSLTILPYHQLATF